MRFIPNLPTLKQDLRASVTVFLVALPLAMGVAAASGYPPVAGLITGIIGGIVVGLLSGAPLQVSGAAAGLTVIVYQGVEQLGLGHMSVAVMLAGIMQIAAGGVGLGRWFQAVSPTVLHAMLAGIGVLILLGQTHALFDASPKGSGLENLLALPETVAHALAPNGLGALAALLLGLFVIAVMMIWPKDPRHRLAILPGPLVAIVASAALAYVLGLPVQHVVLPEGLWDELWRGDVFTVDLLQAIPALLSVALQLALVASAESLLCAAAVDQLHSGPRTRYNKELMAQGVGNALCGMFAALPMTGVIMRSSANVHAGAKTRLSAILHGVWLLLLVSFFDEILALIPMAALAGLLAYTGAKLINPKVIALLYRRGRGEFIIYAATVLVIVSYDLLAGVVLGLALSGLKLLLSLAHLHVKVESASEAQETVMHLQGAATFLRLPKLASALESVPKGARVIVRARDLHLIDDACVEHFEAWRRRHEGSGGRIEVEGRSVFERVGT